MVAKKTPKKKIAGRKAPKKKLPGWILLLSGMLLGLLIAVIGYVNGWVPKPENPNNKPVAQQQKTHSSSVEDISEGLQIKPKKDYDFYKKLPGMEVEIDEEELKQTNDRTQANYTLQLGAFKNLADAEAMKAKVAFVGISAVIQSVDVNQTYWHRVRVGPYIGSRNADVAKRNLEKNGFDAIIVKEK